MHNQAVQSEGPHLDRVVVEVSHNDLVVLVYRCKVRTYRIKQEQMSGLHFR